MPSPPEIIYIGYGKLGRFGSCALPSQDPSRGPSQTQDTAQDVAKDRAQGVAGDMNLPHSPFNESRSFTMTEKRRTKCNHKITWISEMMNIKYLAVTFSGMVAVTIALLLLLTACSAAATAQPTPTQTPTEAPAYWPAEEWRTSTPAEQNMDPDRLEAMIEMIKEQDFAYHSVVVVRNGYLVFEQYLNGWKADSSHHIQSCTKSVSSILIGTLFQNGLLESVDQKMVDLFADYEIANLDERKQAITLEHLLTMSPGMDWHELDYPYEDPNNSLGRMWHSPDAVQHVLDTPMSQEPGQAWSYNSGTSILLGGIIEEVSGKDVLDYARESLFDPLGIEKIRWDQTTGGHYHTDGGLYLKPRDMARIGYLMLRDGEWDGQQIISPEWVAQSSQAHQSTGSLGYGYQWLILPEGVYAANGHYEQKIFVIPAADMVVVFTGYLPDDELHPTDGRLHTTAGPRQRSGRRNRAHGS